MECQDLLGKDWGREKGTPNTSCVQCWCPGPPPKNHSRASWSSEKGKSALSSDFQANGEENVSQRGSRLIPATRNVQKSFQEGQTRGRKAIKS